MKMPTKWLQVEASYRSKLMRLVTNWHLSPQTASLCYGLHFTGNTGMTWWRYG